ncbi:SET and MYND domain-containing protein 1-like [Tropilaelaps mercedesae]|uniref:SET and MYND domain-containing protein 1-like n=1 Tax=Tropilaelaps mercedesae TaxID=418985 RepID=A0A1V9XPK0_9ACAR|nr:SET and MYND domain-containing protein 1-like [Tropilaelaps mercedesae]
MKRENSVSSGKPRRSRVVVLLLIWPAATLASGKGSTSLAAPVVSPAVTSMATKQGGASSTPTVSLQTQTAGQTRPYSLPLTGTASARSVQTQYPLHQPVSAVTGGVASIPQSAEAGVVPQLSVADILALRRAVQQNQLLSRSGVLAP